MATITATRIRNIATMPVGANVGSGLGMDFIEAFRLGKSHWTFVLVDCDMDTYEPVCSVAIRPGNLAEFEKNWVVDYSRDGQLISLDDFTGLDSAICAALEKVIEPAEIARNARALAA